MSNKKAVSKGLSILADVRIIGIVTSAAGAAVVLTSSYKALSPIFEAAENNVLKDYENRRVNWFCFLRSPFIYSGYGRSA